MQLLLFCTDDSTRSFIPIQTMKGASTMSHLKLSMELMSRSYFQSQLY